MRCDHKSDPPGFQPGHTGQPVANFAKKGEKEKMKMVNLNKMPRYLTINSYSLKLQDLPKWQKVAAKICQLSRRGKPSSKYLIFNAVQ